MKIFHLSSPLSFLNTVYLKVVLKQFKESPHSLKTEGFKIFMEVFKEELNKNLPMHIVSEFIRQREQKTEIQTKVIKEILKLFKVLSFQKLIKISKKQENNQYYYLLENNNATEKQVFYQENFFNLYKNELIKYYDGKRKLFLQGSSIDYTKKVVSCFEFEDAESEFISKNDRFELIKITENQLIDRAIHDVVQKSDGLKYLLDNQLHTEAKNLFALLNRFVIPKTPEQKAIQQNYLEIVGNEFRKYIFDKAEVVCSLVLDKETNQVIPNIENQLKFVPEFLKLYNSLTPQIKDYFQDSNLMIQKRDLALAELLNKNEKFYYIFAQYCDSIIKTNASYLQENIEFFEQFIGYFQQKDLFVKIYSRFYNNRLLNNQITDDKIENIVIESMKKVLGYYQIKLILNMQEDYQSSQDINKTIQEQISKEKIITNNILEVKFLRQQRWPLKNLKNDIKLPPSLQLLYQTNVDKFLNLRKDQIYNQSLLYQGVTQQKTNVNLNWQFGTAQIQFNAKTSPILIVSSLQLVILFTLDFYTSENCYVEQIEEEIIEKSIEVEDEQKEEKPAPASKAKGNKKNTKKAGKRGQKKEKEEEIEIEEKKPLKRKAVQEIKKVTKKVKIDPKQALSVEDLAKYTNFSKEDIQIAINPLQKMTILKKNTEKNQDLYSVNMDFALKKQTIKVPSGKNFNNIQNEDEKVEQKEQQLKLERDIETLVIKIIRNEKNIQMPKLIKDVGEQLKQPSLDITQITDIIKDLTQKEFIKHDTDSNMLSYVEN